jgi:hypothetical protein
MVVLELQLQLFVKTVSEFFTDAIKLRLELVEARILIKVVHG